MSIMPPTFPAPVLQFTHDYARSITEQFVIYIEYQDGLPHSVVTTYFVETADTPYWRCCYFDFEPDCKESEKFMYFNSGSRGDPKKLEAPHFVDGSTGCTIWMHPFASFKEGQTPRNATILNEPLLIDGDPNPFNNGREVYDTTYCKFCEKYYDEELCREHHVEIEYDDTKDDNSRAGDIVYFDGTKIE